VMCPHLYNKAADLAGNASSRECCSSNKLPRVAGAAVRRQQLQGQLRALHSSLWCDAVHYRGGGLVELYSGSSASSITWHAAVAVLRHGAAWGTQNCARSNRA
jgi:hypothetical protein